MRGFTLLETLIVVALTVAILFAITNFYAGFNRFYAYQNASANNATFTGRAIAEIDATVLPASSVLPSRAFATGTYSTGSSVLVLELPSTTSAGGVINGAYDYAVFYVSNGTLYKRLEANGSSSRTTVTEQLVSGVIALTFTYDSGDFGSVTRVSTDLTTQSTHRAGTVNTHLTSEAYLRN